MAVLLFFIATWYLSLFFQTFFQHRYAAHGAFHMTPRWQKAFYIFTYIAQGSSYLSPRAYAIMHRMHHAYTDTAEDPHSPNFSKNVLCMMWRTRTFYNRIYKNKMTIEERFTKNLPDWPAFDRWATSTPSRLLWAIVYLAVFLLLGSSLWFLFLLPIVLIMGPFHGAIINWFAHKYGYTNFWLKNSSHNLFSVDLLMLGESYHNNHHKNPSALNFGKRWHEFDPVYPIIRFLAWLRVIRLIKPQIGS